MSSKDLEKMMKDYREKALASRTRYQRFVDAFTLIPITVYFVLSVILNYNAGVQLVATAFGLKFLLGGIVIPLAPNFLSAFQTAALINMLFVTPVPAMWNEAIYTAAAISMWISTILFLGYFVSRYIAYREVFYLDLGLLAFFVPGSILMIVAHNIGALYYYYAGFLVYTLLAIPAIITTAIKRPFTFQYARRLVPKEVQQTDVYKRINYAIGTVWSVIFVANATLSYIIATFVATGWLWLALFITVAFFLIFGVAFQTHFPAWYTRRTFKTPLQKSETPIRLLTKIVGGFLILFGLLSFLYGFLHISSTSMIFNIIEGFLISPLIGLVETILITGAAQISSIIVLLETIVPIILMVAGVGIILGNKWGWYTTIGGLVFYIILVWLGWIFPPNIGIMDWIGTFSYFYVTFAFHTPYEPFFFAAVLLSGVSATFLCYIFPKRDQYIL
ncbi:MAG: hypothetical protein QXS27_01300 [Candidatus Jordarchaeaceae archaeon]